MTQTVVFEHESNRSSLQHRWLESAAAITNLIGAVSPFACAAGSIPKKWNHSAQCQPKAVAAAADIIIRHLQQLTPSIAAEIFSADMVSAWLNVPEAIKLTANDMELAISSVTTDLISAGLLKPAISDSTDSGAATIRKQFLRALESTGGGKIGFDAEAKRFLTVVSKLDGGVANRLLISRNLISVASVLLRIVGNQYTDTKLVGTAYQHLKARLSRYEYTKNDELKPNAEPKLLENVFGNSSTFYSLIEDIKQKLTGRKSQLGAKFSGLEEMKNISAPLMNGLGHCRGLIKTLQQLDLQCSVADACLLKMAKDCNSLSTDKTQPETFDVNHRVRLTCSPISLLAHFTSLWHAIRASEALWSANVKVLEDLEQTLTKLVKKLNSNSPAYQNLSTILDKTKTNLEAAKENAKRLFTSAEKINSGMTDLQKVAIPFCKVRADVLLLTDEFKQEDVNDFLNKFDSIGWKAVLGSLTSYKSTTGVAIDDNDFQEAARQALFQRSDQRMSNGVDYFAVTPSLCLTLGDELGSGTGDIYSRSNSTVEGNITNIIENYNKSACIERDENAFAAYGAHYVKYTGPHMSEIYLEHYKPIHGVNMESLATASSIILERLRTRGSSNTQLDKLHQFISQIIDSSYYVAPVGEASEQSGHLGINEFRNLLKDSKVVLTSDAGDLYRAMRDTGKNQLEIILQLLLRNPAAPENYGIEAATIRSVLDFLKISQTGVYGLLSPKSVTTEPNPATCVFKAMIPEESSGPIQHVSSACENCTSLTLNTCGTTQDDALALQEHLLQDVSGLTEDRVQVLAAYLLRNLESIGKISSIDLPMFLNLINKCKPSSKNAVQTPIV